MRHVHPLLFLGISIAIAGCDEKDDANGGRSVAERPSDSRPSQATDAGAYDGARGGTLSCMPKSTDDDCDTCFKAKCCPAIQACEPECVALLDCFSTCEAEACLDTCYDAHPNGADQFEQVATCTESNCVAECGDSPAPTSE